jgi:GDPmannose 4,6-dehydratase
LQLDNPDDFVLATGETHTIRDFVKTAFECVEIYNWQDYVRKDPAFMRPAEVDVLLGNSLKAREVLGFNPQYCFKDIVYEMVNSDVTRLRRGDKIV